MFLADVSTTNTANNLIKIRENHWRNSASWRRESGKVKEDRGGSRDYKANLFPFFYGINKNFIKGKFNSYMFSSLDKFCHNAANHYRANIIAGERDLQFQSKRRKKIPLSSNFTEEENILVFLQFMTKRRIKTLFRKIERRRAIIEVKELKPWRKRKIVSVIQFMAKTKRKKSTKILV